MLKAFLFSLIPLVASRVSAWVFTVSKPKGLILNIFQALAAGLILGAITKELIPSMLAAQNPMVYIGFIIGVVIMLLIEKFSGGEGTSLMGFLVGYAIEFFITGVLIGISILASNTTLIVISVSLSICSFICTLSICAKLAKTEYKKLRKILTPLFLALAFPIGAIVGSLCATYTSASQTDTLLAFAVAILLYLITRELLPMAFSKKNLYTPIAFFIALLFVFLI